MDLETIVAEITAGDHDGQLDDILSAVVQRVREGAVAFYWRLRVDGDEWTQESVTLAELKFAETVAKVTVTNPDAKDYGRKRPAQMAELNPLIYADHCVALIVAHLHKAAGLPLADAVKKAEAMTAAEVADAVGEYEVVLPPKDDPGSPASTS